MCPPSDPTTFTEGPIPHSTHPRKHYEVRHYKVELHADHVDTCIDKNIRRRSPQRRNVCVNYEFNLEDHVGAVAKTNGGGT